MSSSEEDWPLLVDEGRVMLDGASLFVCCDLLNGALWLDLSFTYDLLSLYA